jgi:transglycosylase-like protein with SLT domain
MSRRWRRTAPRLTAPRAARWRGTAAYGAVVAVIAGGLAHFLPGPRGPELTPGTHVTSSFQQIVLPDVVAVNPAGITAEQLARLRRVHGVREMLAVDGASISAGGRTVNAIGVDPAAFRSWTPLRTASDDGLWSALAGGGFVTTPGTSRLLGLDRGATYTLTGSSPVQMVFGGTAALGLTGISMVVSDRASPGLGLIHDVAVLISAPGARMAALQRQARAVLGTGASVVSMRHQLPVDGSGGSKPANYLDLFRASAAKYCPGMSWTVLAAIGQIESGDGANVGPSTAGALGPMQFLPSTWRVWGITAFGEPGPPDIMDPYDAVPSAARYLCASGAGNPATLSRAIFAYNHADWYVSEVLALARQYAQDYG